MLWSCLSWGMSSVYYSIRVQIRGIGFSHRVGRLRTDYRVVDSEDSAWKSYDPMAKYQSI